MKWIICREAINFWLYKTRVRNLTIMGYFLIVKMLSVVILGKLKVGMGCVDYCKLSTNQIHNMIRDRQELGNN